MKPPCPTCPWRRGADARRIPGFKMELAEELEPTCTDQMGNVFACHWSKDGTELACQGWMVRYGGDNIRVRLLLMHGRIAPEQVWGPFPEEWDLYETYDEMMANLRATWALHEE